MDLCSLVDWLSETHQKGEDITGILELLRDAVAVHEPIWTVECASCGGILHGDKLSPVMPHVAEYAAISDGGTLMPFVCKNGTVACAKPGTARHVKTEVLAMQKVMQSETCNACLDAKELMGWPTGKSCAHCGGDGHLMGTVWDVYVRSRNVTPS